METNCYLVARRTDREGCVALRTAHGQALADLKKKLADMVGDDVQLVVISRPEAYGEYEPYRFVETEDEFVKEVCGMVMFHKITTVSPLSDYRLEITFSTGEVGIYDVKPLIEKYGRFAPLNDKQLFEQVLVDKGGYGVVWNDDIDISADEIYENMEVSTDDPFYSEENIARLERVIADIDAGKVTEHDLIDPDTGRAIGHSWDEVEKDFFTPEEIAESDLRVARIGEVIRTGKLEHKGFIGSVEFLEADNVFFGSVEGVNALISYEGATVEELEEDFRAAIEDYLALEEM